jgi:hypothetical protein
LLSLCAQSCALEADELELLDEDELDELEELELLKLLDEDEPDELEDCPE